MTTAPAPARSADPRSTVDSPDEVVVFLIGMRVNRWRALRSWLPVAAAMPRMLRELSGADLGLLEARSYLSGRVLLVVQYWSSFDALEAYARDPEAEHLPAWRRFSRLVRDSDAVGIFHETYVVPAAAREVLYARMPAHGLGRALGTVPLTAGTMSARRRLSGGRPSRAATPQQGRGPAPRPAPTRA